MSRAEKRREASNLRSARGRRAAIDRVMAGGFFENLPGGVRERVTHPLALRALRETLDAFLRGGKRRVMARISNAAGEAFPRGRFREAWAGRCYLAVDMNARREIVFSTVWGAGEGPRAAELAGALQAVEPKLDALCAAVGEA